MKDEEYWALRADFGYYVVVRAWLRMLSAEMNPGTRSLLDVGSHRTPIATYGWFENRFTVDLEHDPKLPGVISYVGDFLAWTPPQRMDVATCCQVLEHLTDEQVTPFAQKLLATADHVLVSVPYEWPVGLEPDHRQDPVSFDKVTGWFGKPPVERVIVRDTKHSRLVARWCSL